MLGDTASFSSNLHRQDALYLIVMNKNLQVL